MHRCRPAEVLRMVASDARFNERALYLVQSDEAQSRRHLVVVSRQGNAVCTCEQVQTRGMLCRHILKSFIAKVRADTPSYVPQGQTRRLSLISPAPLHSSCSWPHTSAGCVATAPCEVGFSR